MARFMDLTESKKTKTRRYIDPTLGFKALSFDRLDRKLIERFRLNNAAINFLCDELKELIIKDVRGKPIPIDIQIKVTLQYLASNCFELTIADAFHISQKSVSNLIYNITSSLAEISSRFIHLPLTKNDVDKSKVAFMECSRGMPMTIGCLDCSHIRLAVRFTFKILCLQINL